MEGNPPEIGKLIEALRQFARERDWEKFHSPKNISMAMAVEAAEVMELFQWLSEEESLNLGKEKRALLADEIGDVFIYLLMLADKAQIDVLKAAAEKMEKNARKFKTGKDDSGAYSEYGELS